MLVAIFSLAACFDPPPTVPPGPDPSPVALPEAALPEFAFALPTRQAKSPSVGALSEDGERARAILTAVVETYARTPDDAWAAGHGLLALGSGMTLTDGRPAIATLFELYAERPVPSNAALVGFPKRRDAVLVEPHTDLTLKVLTELQVPLDSSFVVAGEPATLADLYRHSMWNVWVTPEAETSLPNFNDAPWALQGLASAAPADLQWTARGGHPMNMNLFTDVVVSDLFVQTRFMADAMAKGEPLQKKKQGIFAYTCGGQHLLQGTAYAVARGFGSDLSRARVEEQVPILFWRLDLELAIYDRVLEENPDYAPILLEQRMKFLGHFVESSHKLAALGIFVPDATQAATMVRARDELIATVLRIDREGHFGDLPAYAKEPRTHQMYLDFVGDSAHALRGIALSTGEGTIAY